VLRRCALPLAIALGALGCGAHAAPVHGSYGTPNRGILVDGVVLEETDAVRWLRNDDRHFALPRLTAAIQRAGASVAAARPGPPLYVGDLSARHGGSASGHRSHRSGVDADLLLFWTTLEGAPIPTPGFRHVGADGLAYDGGTYIRFDVEREWLLVESLLRDPAARVQWIFASEVLEAILLEWAQARGSDPDIVRRAQEVMLQPTGAAVHDDHIHIRTACDQDEIAEGCRIIGPEREWLREDVAADSDATLVSAILEPLDAVGAAGH
jgi:penicillin-insensitive murein DD-endopeptidase